MYIKYKHQHFKEYFKLSKYLLLLFLTYSTILISQNKVIVGAERPELYLNTLLGKRVGLVANQTSKVKKEHLVDVLLNEGVNVIKVFLQNTVLEANQMLERKLRMKLIFKRDCQFILYMEKVRGKPSKEILKDIDIIVFDLQDVGVRFYTYISSLHYVMEACAENNVQLIVLDRPNPNGFYVDGPILDLKFRSFVGMHPVPVVHGMTIGEYAKMINGEKWLDNMIQCSLEIIPCLNYNHNTRYVLPIPPSPNLPNMRSVYLYPSLCFFEGTNISIGRGTNFPFQVFGAPYFTKK